MPENRSAEELSSAVLVEKEGKFFVYQPGLGIVVAGDDVGSAYQQFVEARDEYLKRVERAGLSLDLEVPQQQSRDWSVRRDVRSELGMFVAKTCIVFLFAAALLGPVVLVASRTVERVGGSVGQTLGVLGSVSFSDVSRKAAEVAHDLQELPEEAKQRLQQSVGTIARELAPLVDAWRHSAEPKPLQTGPSTR